jgi:two-component system, OmpR family, sensor histidine kinase BaeS
MLRSLHLKFFLVLFGVALVALSGTLILRQLMLGDFADYIEGNAEDTVYGLLANFEGAYERDQGWKEETETQLITWALTLGYNVRVLDGNGKVVADTEKALARASSAVKRRLASLSHGQEAIVGGAYVPYPLFLSGTRIGTLELKVVATAKESLFVQRTARFLLLSTIVVGGLALLISLVFSSRLTKPIKELALAASAIARGDLRQRVRVTRRDEVGNLGDTFNHMAEALAQQDLLRRKLIADVAHELRTPLAVMRGEIEAMIDGIMVVDERRLESLQEETERLKRMVEGIEELNQAETSALKLMRQTILLRPFLSGIRDRFERVFNEKGVALGLNCRDDAELDADPERLSQIVINLISNALKATDAGGSVSIDVSQEHGGYAITVRDTGKGIDQKELAFVFERFYKGSGGGLGIGLTIAKELAEAHGGRIAVASTPKEGSVFTVHLPASRHSQLFTIHS